MFVFELVRCAGLFLMMLHKQAYYESPKGTFELEI